MITIFCPAYVTPVPAGTYVETVNPPARVALWPPGLVTTTFQGPVAAVDGMPNWQVIAVGETTTTFMPGMLSRTRPGRASRSRRAGSRSPASFVTAIVDPCEPGVRGDGGDRERPGGP